MRKTTSRAFRATATVAGVAALGASAFTGTAAADEGSGIGDVFGDSNSDTSSDYGDDSDYDSDLGSDSDFGGFGNGSPGIDQPGLMTFDMPTLQSKGMKTSGFGDLFGNDEDSDYHDDYGDDRGHGRHHDDGDDDSDCGDHDSDSSHGDKHGQFQNPVQCKGNNFGDGDFQLFGHSYNRRDSYSSKGLRTDSDGVLDLSSILGNKDNDSDSDRYSDGDGDGDDSDFDADSDSDYGSDYGSNFDSDSGSGLSGHRMTMPIG